MPLMKPNGGVIPISAWNMFCMPLPRSYPERKLSTRVAAILVACRSSWTFSSSRSWKVILKGLPCRCRKRPGWNVCCEALSCIRRRLVSSWWTPAICSQPFWNRKIPMPPTFYFARAFRALTCCVTYLTGCPNPPRPRAFPWRGAPLRPPRMMIPSTTRIVWTMMMMSPSAMWRTTWRMNRLKKAGSARQKALSRPLPYPLRAAPPMEPSTRLSVVKMNCAALSGSSAGGRKTIRFSSGRPAQARPPWRKVLRRFYMPRPGAKPGSVSPGSCVGRKSSHWTCPECLQGPNSGVISNNASRLLSTKCCSGAMSSSLSMKSICWWAPVPHPSPV
ncbi:MAG: hypothetical protein BWX80_02640 [Candidatus Hydrogenedentes bacterium ADurb.Bin101]|nr:MAG: hypothetical protein BWX80_02640 [Candidatus Hydrogenedentes bacterium ADurb.Bin101]